MAASGADMIAALVVAAGRGTRAAGDRGPAKQYARIGHRTVLGHCLETFVTHPRIGAVQVVIGADDAALYGETVSGLGKLAHEGLLAPVIGGATRQASVARGLEALAAVNPGLVLIHDAARPFVAPATIDAVIAALDTSVGALPVVPVSDTLKRVSGAAVSETVDRHGLAAAQTPQGFRFTEILTAHRRAAAEGGTEFTDDSAIAEWAGLEVVAVAGDPGNVKITTAADLEAAARRLAPSPGATGVTRVGSGFDVHAFGPGDGVRLCGVDIAHERGLKGHSDADVALHAVCDALYGAVASGDIGEHFPPSDPRWAGADSIQFVEHARGQVERQGGRIVHIDLTIICEEPKIGPHRDAMVRRLAGLLGLDPGAVSVKATTTERLGFAGRREGIAAQATATVVMDGRSRP